MDAAYDHIQEEAYPQDPPPPKDTAAPASNNFQSEVQDAYKAISSSPWAARLGGFLGTVKKQGEQYYDGASKQATAGISTLIKHTRNISVNSGDASSSTATETTPSTSKAPAHDPDAHPDRPESLPADIVKEAEGMLSRFRAEAAKRLKDIEKAEDAADEALLKFGTNIRSFLRDAVTIAPPTEDAAGNPGAVLFESKDSSGKKVVHATRFDAQLHVIHSSLDSFLKDPVSPEWAGWRKDFDVEKKTDEIARDLEKHTELRTAMETLVPEKVEYAAFWERYYFLRHVIESEEQRRREMLKASAPTDEEEVAWDEDSDAESDADKTSTSTPQAAKSATNLAASQGTLKPPAEDTLKPAQPRRSNDEKSVADSDASYDLVSGATSRAPGSPQEKKKAVAEESDEEDWE
ncbi:BSD-domain-containing protein [Karstenula rhodostoma CBS 690.94]|uniref:BSD-domain-containing protein n=1 Tax=Karstenula rhodostoma CBS 690.94 TaxID=1392251 RepID=A0A9P4P6T6_9PLEO|nr:BSD-domain-containing protein [Karstenula rhodostoma CBS 690.94]